MNSPLISIIVPVYQVEKYLEKCINSIINQTYKNLEIILVDDGSTDNCPAICDRFQVEDSRIKVIHQENGGLSHARNVGLEISTGDFIGFVDSDDWIEPNMYELLMSALQETQADIAVCNRQYEFEDSESIPINVKPINRKLYTNKEALRMIIKGGSIIRNAVWDKLFRKNIIQNIRFPKGKIFEDSLWTPQIIGNAKSIICIDYPLYHYLQRSESLTHYEKLIAKRWFDRIEMFKQRTIYFHKYYPSVDKLATLKFQDFCFHEYIKFALYNHQLNIYDDIRNELHLQFCQSGSINIQDVEGFKMKLARILFRFYPNFLTNICIIMQKLHKLKM